MSEITVPATVVEKLKEKKGGICPILDFVQETHQISNQYNGRTLKLIGQDDDILELELSYLKRLAELPEQSRTKSLGKNGTVEWIFKGEQAELVTHLFKKEIYELEKTGEINVNRETNGDYTDCIILSCRYSKYQSVTKKMDTLVKDVESCVRVKENVALNEKHIAKSFADHDHQNIFYCKVISEQKALVIYVKNEHDCEKAKNEWLSYKTGKKNDTFAVAKNSTTNDHSMKAGNATGIVNTRAEITETPKPSKQSNQWEEETSDWNVDEQGPTLSNESSENKTSSGQQSNKENDSMKTCSNSWKEKVESAQSHTNTVLPANSTFKEENVVTVGETLANSSTIRKPGVMSGSGDKTKYKFDCSGMTVLVYKESITEIKGIDAITNAANDGLFHGGGVAYYISKAAGDKMDQECKEYIDKHSRIPVSENFVSNPGKMSCKGIIHAVGPMWCDYQDKEQCANDLYRTIINVLEVTKKKSWKSVALPAISSGIFGVPKQLCAEMYVKAFVDFVDHGTVTDVHFIDVNQDILDMVIDAHKQWVNNPACLSFKNARQYPVVLSSKTTSRTKRSVSTEEQPVIKFVGEDSFFRERRFQYRVLDKLKLYVYCGDLLKLDNVDAIVVPLQPDMTGGALAQGVKHLGGTKYKKELDAFRMMKEGDVFVCPKSGGMKTNVVHVILSPITRTDPKTLAQYSAMSGNLFSQVHFQRVALPLVGSGLLDQNARSKLGKSLLDGIIDVWTSPEKKIKISELHVVNMEPASTTCLQNELKQITLGKTETKFSGSVGTRQDDKYTKYSMEYLTSEEEKFLYDVQGWTKHRPLPEPKSVTMTDQIAKAKKGIVSQGKQTTSQDGKSNHGAKGHGIKLADGKQNQKSGSKTDQTTKSAVETGVVLDGKCCYHPQKEAKLFLKCKHYFCDVCYISVGPEGKCLICKVDQNHNFDSEEFNEKQTCPICQDAIKDPEALPCKHMFCKECLVQLKQHKPECPVCGHQFGQVTGNQPDGEMLYKVTGDVNLPGYDGYGTIVIKYVFRDGKQQKNHPFPGRVYKGIQRVAFLPDTTEGHKVLLLLRRAFDRRLVFTIGESRTTGKEGVITWNDIHHKTRIRGGPEKFGYPDPTYLSRVKEELAAKGVVN